MAEYCIGGSYGRNAALGYFSQVWSTTNACRQDAPRVVHRKNSMCLALKGSHQWQVHSARHQAQVSPPADGSLVRTSSSWKGMEVDGHDSGQGMASGWEN